MDSTKRHLKYFQDEMVGSKSKLSATLATYKQTKKVDLKKIPLYFNPDVKESPNKDQSLFIPNDISTPRSSYMLRTDNSITSLDRTSISSRMTELSHQIRNSSIGLADLCNQYCDANASQLSLNYEFNEESFASGDLAVAKIAKQEQSWIKQKDTLGGMNPITESLFSEISTCEQVLSITDFFRKNSELAEMCRKSTPTKQTAPTPIIENLNLTETINESSFVLTELENAIALNDNTNQFVELIDNVLTKHNLGKENKRSSVKPLRKSLRTWSSVEVLKENFPQETISRPVSAEPLKDSQNLDNSKFLHTARSLESLPGGKLPIETNKIELVWGCVSEGKRKMHSFTLRNKSPNKLQLQVSSSLTNFKILSSQSEMESVSVLPILMYPSESRCFTVAFSPTSTGAFIGKLIFKPVNDTLQMQQTKRQQLMMFGYGGYAKIEFQNVFKDTNMRMWLPLGKLENKSQLCKKFTLKNVGNLAAFACLKFVSKALYGNSKVAISPSQLVLIPNEETTILVTYTPTKEDVKHLFIVTNTQIIEIGFIQIITGAEALRGRMRRLFKKLKHTGSNKIELVEELSKKFPNEKIPIDLNFFMETVGSFKELMQDLDTREISITLEKDSERTLIAQIGGIEETSMFQSLCEDVPTVATSKALIGSCTVEPNSLILTSNKWEDCILVTNLGTKPLQFQCSILPSDLNSLLNVTPPEGILSPNEIALFNVNCNFNKIVSQQLFKIQIFVDDEVFEVDVKVINFNRQHGDRLKKSFKV